jgi:hypothetical protein
MRRSQLRDAAHPPFIKRAVSRAHCLGPGAIDLFRVSPELKQTVTGLRVEPVGLLACLGIRIGREIHDAIDSIVLVEQVATVLGHAEASRKAAG